MRGGAVVGQGRIEVVILANDNVAGIITFRNETRLVKLYYSCSKHKLLDLNSYVHPC